jgi:glycine/D-amino acid oxidase-like deaminating enzyme
MPRITTLPRNDSPNGWELILPPRGAAPALKGATHAEFVVIGAGFAGLAAARRLAENRPHDRIALLDAQAVAAGASGRNSGIAMDVPYNIGTSSSAVATLQRHVRLNRAALAYLEDVIRRHGIDCHWSRRGKYHAAITDKGKHRALEPVVQELTALGEPYTWLTRRELADRIGTSYFAAAIHLPGCVLLDTAALVRGLADTLPTNVVLYENSPVIEFEYRNGIRLTTPQGSLTADTVILATNGFVREFGFCRGRLLNYAIYASLTRRLTDGELQQMGSDPDWGLTPAHVNGGTAMRFTADRRLFLRETVAFAPNFARPDIDLRGVARRHATRLRARYPMLPAEAIQYTWVGYDAMSSNRAHAFGRSAPDVYLAVCQNGVGITKGTISGLLAADLATSRDNPLIADIEGLGTPARLLPRPLLDLHMSVQALWDRWRNHHEQH